MKSLSFCLLAALAVYSFSSCGQGISHEKIVTTAQTFAADTVPQNLCHYSQATFAAGCFWHEQTLFESIKGVTKVIAGYAGGTTANPTYEQVETGTTGHAETVDVYYDSSKISFPALVRVFVEAQEDPTQVDGQGPDEGTQYRSIAFYRNPMERQEINMYIDSLNRSGAYRSKIAAEVTPFAQFWPAEDYHQDYINTNHDNPYVQNVSIPDIVHYQEKHPDMIKHGHSFVGK
jgi:peptide-methionine (S)-S-oxide reductase